jgi:hypothetical protein
MEDAYKCFCRTNMDNLIMGNFVINKSDLGQIEVKKYAKEILLD